MDIGHIAGDTDQPLGDIDLGIKHDEFNPDEELRELFSKFAKNGILLDSVSFEVIMLSNCVSVRNCHFSAKTTP